jgi:hypothetical protein
VALVLYALRGRAVFAPGSTRVADGYRAVHGVTILMFAFVTSGLTILGSRHGSIPAPHGSPPEEQVMMEVILRKTQTLARRPLVRSRAMPAIPAAQGTGLRGHRGQQEADRRGAEGPVTKRPPRGGRRAVATQVKLVIAAKRRGGKLFGRSRRRTRGTHGAGSTVDKRKLELEYPIKTSFHSVTVPHSDVTPR